MRCLPLGGSYKGGKTSATWEASSLARRPARMEGEPRGLTGERSGLFLAAGAEEELHSQYHQALLSPTCKSTGAGRGGVLELRLRVSEAGRGLGLESSVTTPGGV